MNEFEIEVRLDSANRRYRAVGGRFDLSIVVSQGRWSITSGGGSPRLSVAGVTATEAFEAAEAEVAAFESQDKALANTLGLEAAL